MREIKFRVWNSRDKKWDAPSLLAVFNADGILGHLNDSKSEHTIIQQYTGLKDKNGVEIYEGDILEIYRHNQPEEVSYVVDGNTAFGFFKHDSIERTEGSFETLGDYTGSSGYKVIGNIFENPELLELK